jgi:cyclopropane fatty-acyl-phospholipid synthase-like methyltransferase
MKSDFSRLAKYFDASNEELLRSTDEGVDEKHLSHYENRLGKYLKDPNVKKILDLGCGEGKILKEFASRHPDKEFVGVDLSSSNINLAKEKFQIENVKYFVADVSTSIKSLGEFDLIYSFSLIQYFDTQVSQDLVNNISTILRTKGVLVHMSIPDDVHYFRTLVPEKLNLLIILKIFLKMLLTVNNSKHRIYGRNGFWWSKSLMMDIHKSKYRKTICLPSDSWYRFDFIAEK